ncbi:hypothetical protein F5876DRAFT_90372 [Lentinula aff. lateritia]|uniref:Uncharacterized protein n=1 Tax=Lentinula aff. lateritia TaxID=2804960 RepID=A0ACC1TST5_9AGAR|nr:hypothetical protein F5876DRAFT_90372 [Lentinula aff. lateritia]
MFNSGWASHVKLDLESLFTFKYRCRAATWEQTLGKKLEVGDIILLRDNEHVPADVINLDRETNLKPRHSVKAIMGITSEEDIKRSSFYLHSEPPHQNLYLYHGVLRYKDIIMGECKQERKIERETNFNVMVTFVLLLAMCIFVAILNELQDAKMGLSTEFFEIEVDATGSHILNALVAFVYVYSCFSVLSPDHVSSPSKNLVPISLYISIEIVKTIQVYFLLQDKCSVNGVIYGEGVTEAQRGAATRNGNTAEMLNPEKLNEKLATSSSKVWYLQPE